MNVNDVPQSFQIGLDGFIWFVGVVESVIDPLTVGRVKLRIFGWHDPDTSVLPTEFLPWAYPVRPLSHSRTQSDVRVGDWVVGWFLDGKMAQQPMFFGVLPAITQT